MREGGMGRMKAPLRVALAGNPNSGKTTLFNGITGAHHKVGNYPGVTVEKREGAASFEGRVYSIVDLPGTYSLTAYSIDEVIARDFVLDERPDVVVSVMDSTNLERNLYLCLQFQELGLPLVGALNMSDEAAEKGIDIDEAMLSDLLGLPLVKTAGAKGQGVAELLRVIAAVAAGKPAVSRTVDYGSEVEEWLGRLEALLGSDAGFASGHPCRWLAVKLLEKDAEAAGRLAGHPKEAEIRAVAAEAVAWIEGHFAKDAEVVIA